MMKMKVRRISPKVNPRKRRKVIMKVTTVAVNMRRHARHGLMLILIVELIEFISLLVVGKGLLDFRTVLLIHGLLVRFV